METRSRDCARSLNERTTLRLSLSDLAPGIERLSLRMPTNMISAELRLDLFDLEALDDVAFLHVLEVLERDAALEPLGDLLHVVLEAAQAREPAGPDDDAVA